VALVVAVLCLVAAVPTAVGQQLPETDNTVTRIDVQADGDARWAVVVRTRLDSDADVVAYETFQQGVRNDSGAYLDPFSERIRGVVATADAGTDRPMAAESVTVSTRIQQVPRRWGVLEYTFEWTNFARPDGDRLVVGDTFDGGLFIAANDTLVVRGPDGYAVQQVTPSPTTRDGVTATWRGPREFARGAPAVTFVPSDAGTESAPGVAAEPVVLGVVVLALAAGGIVLYRRRGGTPSADSDDAAPIRTDANRVLALLAENGGQVRQATVAEEFDWSASKTSRVLSGLADEGRIEKLRLGRENVISLPDEES